MYSWDNVFSWIINQYSLFQKNLRKIWKEQRPCHLHWTTKGLGWLVFEKNWEKVGKSQGILVRVKELESSENESISFLFFKPCSRNIFMKKSPVKLFQIKEMSRKVREFHSWEKLTTFGCISLLDTWNCGCWVLLAVQSNVYLHFGVDPFWMVGSFTLPFMEGI